ncbi:inner membrane protein YhjD [Candidatus Mycobacterium wuenschmannii]|uniref:Inner membrane protein YhjD n=1 Tax=Candidatus Mycobacterium wuenschmannii TaxID=3027808 RepID=A0ABY8VZV7_9MYCO|nr:inner membrane protein YhjD [Candidatus Mycobacterium wuenschmannii]WIM87742.1 inner membrane protein YhjD [Candidatus Mycobacterium wuenschmannii]
MSEPAKASVLQRLRTRYAWLDHAIRANDWFDECQGNFFAAGLTYYTIFALFPLLMVGFSVAGFLLFQHPEVLDAIDKKVRHAVPGVLGQQMLDLMNSAIEARTSVGVIGLTVAVWVGLSWMSNLRVALTELWRQSNGSHGYVRTKFSDLGAMVSSFVAIFATLALSALAGAAPMARLLRTVGVHDLPVLDALLRGASLLVSFLLSWLVFGWMIARLPRYPVDFRSSVRAALLAAVGFELFKLVATIYLKSVLRSPAGATFGPVLGLMVFAYVTARLLLYATAWAATADGHPLADREDPPRASPEISVTVPRLPPVDALKARQITTAAVVGAIGALGLSRLTRRGKDG